MLSTQQRAAYDLLGVSPFDDAKTIQSAWRALVRTYHPDQYRGDKAGANARLAELNDAYDVVEAFRKEDLAHLRAQYAARCQTKQQRHARERRAAKDERAQAAQRPHAARKTTDDAQAKAQTQPRTPGNSITPKPRNTRPAQERRLVEKAVRAFMATRHAHRKYGSATGPKVSLAA